MTLKERMDAIRAALATACPARVVARDLKDFADRAKADISSGVFTLISRGEGGYKNYNGREGLDGKHRMMLVGQIELAESAAPSEVEDAEFAMVEDVKGFLRALPPTLCSLVMTGFAQSGQTDSPYGWVAIELEMMDE